MDKEMLEKAQMRLYLKVQIRRIREILSLKKLQLLCKLKMIVQRFFPQRCYLRMSEDSGIDIQLHLCVALIEGIL